MVMSTQLPGRGLEEYNYAPVYSSTIALHCGGATAVVEGSGDHKTMALLSKPLHGGGRDSSKAGWRLWAWRESREQA